MRTRKKKWAAAELSGNKMVVLPENAKAAIHAAHNGREIHVEVGCGKGRFITQMAARHPNICFIALEREPTIAAHAAKRTREAGISCLFLLADAAALPDIFAPGEIKCLYLNFPDPWHRKKKWVKRRLTHDNFLKMYEALRIPCVRLKTDNRVLFEFSLMAFSRRGWVLTDVSLNLHAGECDDNVITEYEEKFMEAGPIYRLEARPKPEV